MLFCGIVLASNVLAVEPMRVLVIGDSHSVGPFGRQIHDLIKNDERYQVKTVGSCGSVARWYFTGTTSPCGFYQQDLDGKVTRAPKAPTPLVENLLAEVKPDYVVIELGGNYTNTSDEFMLKDTTALLDFIESKLGKGRCVWTGVPDSRNPERIPRLYRLLGEVTKGRCPLVHAYNFTKYPAVGGDGVHYGGVQGANETIKWATEVKKELDNLVFPQ